MEIIFSSRYPIEMILLFINKKKNVQWNNYIQSYVQRNLNINKIAIL